MTITQNIAAAFLGLSTLGAHAQTSTTEDWCYGTAWYNSAFGSRHYHTENGKLVHSSRDVIRHQEINPGIGLTCYKRDNPAASFSLGAYPNSNWGRSDYVGVGYDFARTQKAGTIYSAGVFMAAFTGYDEFAPKGLGGIAVIPGYTLTAKGEKFGLEAKIVTNLLAPEERRRVIFGFSWLMKF